MNLWSGAGIETGRTVNPQHAIALDVQVIPTPILLCSPRVKK